MTCVFSCFIPQFYLPSYTPPRLYAYRYQLIGVYTEPDYYCLNVARSLNVARTLPKPHTCAAHDCSWRWRTLVRELCPSRAAGQLCIKPPVQGFVQCPSPQQREFTVGQKEVNFPL
jgi:hypothetical protein